MMERIEGVNSSLATAIRTAVVVAMAWGMVLLTHAQNGLSGAGRRECSIKSAAQNDRQGCAGFVGNQERGAYTRQSGHNPKT